MKQSVSENKKVTLHGKELYGEIYMITNIVNGKIYIGQTTGTVRDRFLRHISEALRKKQGCYYFQNAIKKYGKESFVYESICYCFSEEEFNYAERSLIKEYNSTNMNVGYNISPGGSGIAVYNRDKRSSSQKGKKRSAETREKIRIAVKNSPIKRIPPSPKGRKQRFCDIVKRRLTRIKNQMAKEKVINPKITRIAKEKIIKPKIIYVTKEKIIKPKAIPKMPPNELRKKQVLQISVNGEIINRFDSVASARRHIKVSSLTRVLKNPFDWKARGFYFVYLDYYEKNIDKIKTFV